MQCIPIHFFSLQDECSSQPDETTQEGAFALLRAWTRTSCAHTESTQCGIWPTGPAVRKDAARPHPLGCITWGAASPNTSPNVGHWLPRPHPTLYRQDSKIRPKYGHLFRWCSVFLGFLYMLGFFWGIHYSQIANLTSGHIAIFFWWFLELPKNRPNLDCRTPYLSQKHFKQYKKTWEHPWNIFSYLRIWSSEIVKGMCA